MAICVTTRPVRSLPLDGPERRQIVLEDRCQIDPRELNGRRETVDQGARPGDEQGEADHEPIGLDIEEERKRHLRLGSGDEGLGQTRKEQANRRRGHGQHEALDHQLPDDAETARAQRKARGDLAAPADAADQHQAGDVGADDDQQQRRHGAHQSDGRQQERLRAIRPVPDRRQKHPVGDVVLRELRSQFRGEAFGLRARLRHGAARRQPHERQDPVAAAVGDVVVLQQPWLHQDRHEQIRRQADDPAAEVWRGDANHRHRLGVEVNGPPHNGGIGSKHTTPQAVAENDDRVLPERDLVGREQRSPELDRHAERGEVVPGDEFDRRELTARALPDDHALDR